MGERKDTKLWGGRFEREPDARFDAFQRSFEFDRRLLPYEIAVDRAWAEALEPIGVFTAAEVALTLGALDKIAARVEADPSWVDAFGSDAEDVHHFVEKALVSELGPLGWKLHTGRSRNELVATDFRLFVIAAASETKRGLARLIGALLAQAKAKLGVPMAGMTHMQHAQPILLSHFLMAHAEAFARDAARIENAARSADACPMGSGALAGNSFSIDRAAIARRLGFSKITANSLDAVSDRDFALEFLFALTTLAMHLSRLAEDMVLFATPEFGFIELPDEFSTGSSLMPQKKNPDAWELIRGKTGRIYGALFTLLTTCKGLPSSYQRDLQEDKEALFAAHDQALAVTQIAAATLAATKFNETNLRKAAQDPVLVATELADYLVACGVPFREAHEVVGQVLRVAEQEGKSIREMPIERLKQFSPAFGRDVATVLTLESSLARRAVAGGTAPAAVRAALEQFKTRLGKIEESQ